MISHRGVTLVVVALAAVAGCSSDNNPTAGPTPSQIAARSVIAQSAPVNTAVGAPPSVLVRDGSGTPVAGVTVTFAVTGGGGTLLPAMPVVTDASGIATVGSWTLGATPGGNTLSATATGSGITGNPVQFAATGLGFTIAARSVMTQSALLNTAVGAPPSVLVRNESGTPVVGMPVTFAVTAGGGTVLPATPVVTDASGIATVGSWTLGPTQGADTLSATATGSDIAGNPVLFAASGLALTQQGLKLVGTGAVGPAPSQGYSVSLSADGNTAMVGGFGDNGGAGAAWAWTRSGGVWTQQGFKLVGTGAVGAANQGYSVSLSADGNTAIVGGVLDNDAAGAAWVWTRSGGVWTQQGSKLVGTGAVGAAQGISVSLSADGNTAMVGGFGGGAGAAWVWTRSGNVWTQQGSKLVGTGAAGAAQGISVSLSADGNTAIVGGAYDNGGAGAAWVWTRSGGVWTQQGSKLVGTGAVGAADQGLVVSLSADGNTAIVGGSDDNGGAGAAWVWTRSGGVWTQQGSKLVGTGAVGNAYQGHSVSLSADGNTAIVGGSYDNGGAGAAWVWTRSGNVWTQQGSKLVGTGTVGAAQGISVSLSADGNTAIVGGSDDVGSAGAAWVFTRP